MTAFLGELSYLPEPTVAFGHGVWMALLFWKLLGFSAEDSAEMRAFGRFQIGLPMPNCAVYAVEQLAPGKWGLQGKEAIRRRLAAASDAGALGSVGRRRRTSNGRPTFGDPAMNSSRLLFDSRSKALSIDDQ